MYLRSIIEEVPHIFKRPVLSIEPQDPLFKAATFLAIGPQIYADGLVVLDGKTPAGRIGGKHIIKFILESKGHEWEHAPASSLMDRTVCGIDAGSSLNYALDVFNETKFGFAPITVNYRVVTSLSIRDVQRIAASSSAPSSKLDGPVRRLSSPIVSLRDDASLGNILATMISNNIRNVVVTAGSEEVKKDLLIINDRKVLEYLLSYSGRQIMSEKGIKGLYEVNVKELELLLPKMVYPDLPARKAAELMSDACTPCLLVGNGFSEGETVSPTIVTPWDIVMKGLYHNE
jgi:CBS domain-containing protein